MPEDEDPDRAAILKRRSRWIALALTGAAAGTTMSACACLGVSAYDAGTDAGPDAGTDAGADPDADVDGG